MPLILVEAAAALVISCFPVGPPNEQVHQCRGLAAAREDKMRTAEEVAIDQIARAMAANSGQVWDRLDYYPGYLRGRWRDEARALLVSLASDRSRAGS